MIEERRALPSRGKKMVGPFLFVDQKGPAEVLLGNGLAGRTDACDFPAEAAANPYEFAARVRAKLGDDRRLVRLYGTSTVIARLTGDKSRARLYLLSFGSRRQQDAGERADELGLYICGGRGEQSRRTPDELRRIADALTAALNAPGVDLAAAALVVARLECRAGLHRHADGGVGVEHPARAVGDLGGGDRAGPYVAAFALLRHRARGRAGVPPSPQS